MKIYAVGGFGEIGNNCIIMDNGTDAIMIDCGLMFSGDFMYGVDFIVPNPEAFRSFIPRLRALIITHGHEDHIGAIPFTLKDIKIPVYASNFASKIIKKKMREHELPHKINPFTPGDELNIESFKIQTLQVNHSIPEASAIAVDTDDGWIVVTGDFKFETSSQTINKFSKADFKKLQKKGVLLAISDSTNVERKGKAISEEVATENLKKIIKKAKALTIIALFPSNIERIGNILEIADDLNKKVFLSGKSMEDLIGYAKEVGYLNKHAHVIHELEDLPNHERKNSIVLSTGTQGEWRSALWRISIAENRDVKIESGDQVLLSSRFIPGNERSITQMIDNLYKLGAEVFFGDCKIHSTGHGQEDDLTDMIKLLKPKYFIPGHGDYRYLVKHRRLAIENGIKEQNTMVIEDGDVIEVNENQFEKIDKIEPERLFIESEGHNDVSKQVLKDRKKLSDNGILFALLIRDLSGDSAHTFKPVKLFAKGFLEDDRANVLFERAEHYIDGYIAHYQGQDLKEDVRIELRRFFRKELDKRPVVLSILIDI